MKKRSDVKNKKPKITVFSIILFTFLAIYAFSLIVLFLWGLMSSFKSPNEFRINTYGLPKEWVWNYGVVLSKYSLPVNTPDGTIYVGIAKQFVNAIYYAFGCSFVQTFTQFIVAYACARFGFKFSKVIYTTVIIVMIIPIVGSLPSEIQMAKNFGLYDSIWGLYVMKLNFLGIYFLVFYSILKSLPKTFTEAAKIDGAHNFTIMLKIIFPLTITTFATILLLNFIAYWNDYQVPLIYLPSYPTIALGLFRMGTSSDNTLVKVPMRMASAMLVFMPILIVYIFTNKRLLGNLTAGGIKG